MARFTAETDIEVRAPAAVAFAVVLSDVATTSGDGDTIAEHHPLTAGPVQPGFRWRQSLVHDRHRCSMDWTVRALEEPHRFEQVFDHYCAVVGRRTNGGERWTFAERGLVTVVTLTSWRELPLLGMSVRLLLAGGVLPGERLSFRRRLSYLQFEAEREVRAAREAARPHPAG